jgi:carbon storage regulator
MLILTRRPEEALQIGTNIVVTVLGIKGNQVRLGIRAPTDIVIDREEVHLRKQRELLVATTQTQTIARHSATDRR